MATVEPNASYTHTLEVRVKHADSLPQKRLRDVLFKASEEFEGPIPDKAELVSVQRSGDGTVLRFTWYEQAEL